MKMSRVAKLQAVGAAIFAASFAALLLAGAGVWTLLLFPVAMWNYYEGWSMRDPRLRGGDIVEGQEAAASEGTTRVVDPSAR